MTTRESGRIKEADKKRVLDEATRRRRLRKVLEALEQDNFHDDPHSDLVMSKKLPKFQDSIDTQRNRKPKRKVIDYKTRYRKNFLQLLEEDKQNHQQNDSPSYSTAQVGSSKCPCRNFCAVCGFPSTYTCTACGTRYCCLNCLGTHLDTRCQKWTA